MCLYKRYAKGYLNFVYDVDYNVTVKPEYCFGFSGIEVLDNFVAYRKVIISIFQDMANSDSDFHIAICETDRDTVLLPIKSIFAILFTIGSKGDLLNNNIFINSTIFKDSLKKVKRKYINTAISILEDYGFIFEGNVWGKCGFYFYYPDNEKVILGLYSFTHTINSEINSSVSFNNRFTAMDSRLYSFSHDEEKQIDVLQELFRFIKGEKEKEAISIFHNQMVDRGYNYALSIDIFDSDHYNSGISIRYDFSQYEPRAVVRANITNKSSRIGIWLKNLAKQSEYIQNLSYSFKENCALLFDDCKENSCRNNMNAEKCKGRLVFKLGKVEYEKCTYNTAWGYIGNKAVFKAEKDEIGIYVYLIDNNNM